MKKKKGQLQISFAWIFAILVGAFILFLAIYVTTRVAETGGELSTVKTAKEISVLINPLETGVETGKVVSLKMPVETRIYNNCTLEGTFGKQVIKMSQKSFNAWTETDLVTQIPNKYIFSGNYEQGKDFIIFAKPFEFPFKVSDLIYILSEERKYCFLDPPARITSELRDLNKSNLFTAESSCPGNSIEVCFGNSGCDINVVETRKSVDKKSSNGTQTVFYETDALMYAAIFSDKNVYECQIKRLMQRTETLAKLYEEKRQLISRQTCSDNINLQLLESSAGFAKDSRDLASVGEVSEEVNAQNDFATCRLW